MEYLKIINENKSRFQHFNSLKYQRFQDLLPHVNVRRVINAIPFLLCVNHRKLPGFVEGDVPCGITSYSPDEETKKFIKAKYPTARAEIDHANRFIQMLAVMGSVGTVAYNKKSDFDYWVCVNSRSVSKEQLANFMQKIDAIQKWAAREVDVPVHLFVNDIDKIRNNIFAEDEEEAFGSTVGAVLKDEFFRSSIIIAGKIPFWWVVPHFVKDEEYDAFFARLPEEMRDYEFVDLGNLYEISKEDFLGAALFQIIKSLGNPFKSIIKIGVLEKYLFGEGYSLLSQKIKMNILRGSPGQHHARLVPPHVRRGLRLLRQGDEGQEPPSHPQAEPLPEGRPADLAVHRRQGPEEHPLQGEGDVPLREGMGVDHEGHQGP